MVLYLGISPTCMKYIFTRGYICFDIAVIIHDMLKTYLDKQKKTFTWKKNTLATSPCASLSYLNPGGGSAYLLDHFTLPIYILYISAVKMNAFIFALILKDLMRKHYYAINTALLTSFDLCDDVCRNSFLTDLWRKRWGQWGDPAVVTDPLL